MQKRKQLLPFLLLLILCLGIFHTTAAAAGKIPAKVTGLKAKASESVVTLNWKKASNATSYQIYMKTGQTGTYKRIATVKATTYTRKKLKNNITYSFRIRSVCSTGSQTTYSTAYSSVVTAKPQVKNSAPPSGVKCYQSGNGKASLSWNSVSNVNGYAIYVYNASSKSYKLVAKTTETSYEVTGLTNGKTQYIKLKSYRTINGVTGYSSKFSSVVVVKPQKLTAAVSAIHPLWYKGTVTSTITAKPAASGSKTQVVKKGTKVTVLTYASICKVKLPNGQQVYIKFANLNLTSTIYTKTSYSRTVKEDFANLNGYSSPTKYLIWVSTYSQEYCLYTGSRGKWKLLRTAKIATGKETNPTGARICKITRKEERWSYDGGMYQAPIVYFWYGNAFHSRLHNSDGSIADPTIGRPVSSGCVRMYDEDIQYIYDNCPAGTTVVIY